MPKVQLVVVTVVSVYFFVLETNLNTGFAAIYGGMISWVNTHLINRHCHKQEALDITPQASVRMMAVSIIMRMGLVAALVLIGLGILGLNANALIIGLVFGLVGFLMDKGLQK